MSILPVAVLPTRTVFSRTNGFNPFGGYALVRYENVQGAFSLTTLTTQDVFKPPVVAPLEIIQLQTWWRGIFIIRSFNAEMLDSFGSVIKRRRYGYYQGAYADLNADIHYLNFDKQLTGYYKGYTGDNGFPNWADNFPPPIPPLPNIFASGTSAGEGNTRPLATLIKGELTKTVIADIYISAVYSWITVSTPTWAVVDV